MSAEILDGKLIAGRVREEVAADAKKFAEQHGRTPRLEVVLVGEDPASQVYVRNKERAAIECGIRGSVIRLPAETTQAALLELVHKLSGDDDVDGILVQLPLPSHLDSASIVRAIDPRKDVDGLHPLNTGYLAVGEKGLRPCTPVGCMRLLAETKIDLTGKHAVVIGRSNLVGKPVALMLLEKNATVTIAHSKTHDLAGVVRSADVVVAAVGRSEIVRGSWIKDGAVVIDVGINRGADGKLKGDVAFDEAREKASWITPVPGGVGAMTIAMLLRNTVDAAVARTNGARV